MTSIIPKQYEHNPSARRIILSVAQKQKREGLHVGHYTRELSELTGIQPADDREPEQYVYVGEPIETDYSNPF